MENERDFQVPSFLQGQSVEEIHARMMRMLPANLDKSEGQFPWEYTRPTANEKAEFVEFVLLNAIKSIWPMFTQEDYVMDYHAETRGLFRREAKPAKAYIAVTGLAGTVIPKNFKFTTPATYDAPGVVFKTDLEVTLGDETVSIPATAETSGKQGNVPAGTITLMDSPIKGIESITNPEPAYDGLDEESTESVRARILDYDRTQGVSFVGSVSDYRRWAFEVYGVGSCIVEGAKDDSGTVTMIISDMDGKPASADLCQEVYDHIMRPDAPMERLAPTNALLNVIAPETLKITISAALLLDGTVILDEVKRQFQRNISLYYRDVADAYNDDTARVVIRYNDISAVLVNTAGVLDHSGLLVNGGSENLTITIGQMPETTETEMSFTEAAGAF